MESYQDCGMVGSLHIWSCLQCGALVVSKGQHNEWHESFEKNVRDIISRVFREAREYAERTQSVSR